MRRGAELRLSGVKLSSSARAALNERVERVGPTRAAYDLGTSPTTLIKMQDGLPVRSLVAENIEVWAKKEARSR